MPDLKGSSAAVPLILLQPLREGVEHFSEPLGIRSLVPEADASGTQVGSSYSYMTARDWLRVTCTDPCLSGILLREAASQAGPEVEPSPRQRSCSPRRWGHHCLQCPRSRTLALLHLCSHPQHAKAEQKLQREAHGKFG